MVNLIVDGSSLGSRASFVNPYEFFNMVNAVVKEVKATRLFICFDSGEVNHRQAIYPQYKANRKSDEDRKTYLRKLIKSLRLAGISTILAPEGDDAIYTVARKLRDAYIVSGDSDLLCLADQYETIFYGSAWRDRRVYSPEDVKTKFGVYPNRLWEYKALVGDVADNIPGCKGIGPKAAIELLSEYDSLGSLVEDLILGRCSNRFSKKLENGVESIRVSYALAKLYEIDVVVEPDNHIYDMNKMTKAVHCLRREL